jgi:hypothetical protein
VKLEDGKLVRVVVEVHEAYDAHVDATIGWLSFGALALLVAAQHAQKYRLLSILSPCQYAEITLGPSRIPSVLTRAPCFRKVLPVLPHRLGYKTGYKT